MCPLTFSEVEKGLGADIHAQYMIIPRATQRNHHHQDNYRHPYITEPCYQSRTTQPDTHPSYSFTLTLTLTLTLISILTFILTLTLTLTLTFTLTLTLTLALPSSLAPDPTAKVCGGHPHSYE